MMEKSLFDFSDYKNYLKFVADQRPGRGRGFRTKLASSIECQISYVSKILGGDSDFSLEQADLINKFLGHGEDESRFFILLVEISRSGTASLKKYFQKQLDEIQRKRQLIKERVPVKATLSRENQATYYSAWYFAAVHIMIGVKQFKTKDALSKHLGLPVRRISEILDFLIQTGLAVRNEDGTYSTGR